MISGLEIDRERLMVEMTNLVEDFLFLKLAELGSCPFEVEACLFCDATHGDDGLYLIDRWMVVW